MEYNTTIETQGQTIIGTIDVSNYAMTAAFRSTIIEEPVSYYSHQTQTHIDYITDAHRKLKAWELGEICFTDTPPDYQAMVDKELSILKKLNDYTSRYNLTRIVHNGVFDMAMAGIFLMTLDPYPDEHQTATIVLERIRWLTERMKTTKEEPIAPPSVQEDGNLDSQEVSFLCHMIKELKLAPPLKKSIVYGDKLKFFTNQVLFALYQYCEDKKMSCTKSVQCFAEKLHPFIAPNLTANSLQQRIGRANEEKGKTFIGESRLKNLTYTSLMNEMDWKEGKAKNRFKKWDGLYELIEDAAQRFNMTEKLNDKPEIC